MKIGFPNHPRKNIIKEIDWIAKNGFDFVDLFFEEDKAIPEKIDVRKVKKLLKKYNLGTVGHLAWYLPIGSPIKSLRKAAISEACKYFPLFKQLGAEFVTVHSHWSPDLFSFEEGTKFQIESLKELVKKAKNFSLGLMYEPIDTPQDTIESVCRILNSIPQIFFHLDLGHLILFGKEPIEFIEKFHQKLKHIHLHDNFGNSDLHLPMGTGIIDWEKTLKILKTYYDGTITLEIFSRDKDYVLLSKEKLRKLWDKV